MLLVLQLWVFAHWSEESVSLYRLTRVPSIISSSGPKSCSSSCQQTNALNPPESSFMFETAAPQLHAVKKNKGLLLQWNINQGQGTGSCWEVNSLQSHSCSHPSSATRTGKCHMCCDPAASLCTDSTFLMWELGGGAPGETFREMGWWFRPASASRAGWIQPSQHSSGDEQPSALSQQQPSCCTGGCNIHLSTSMSHVTLRECDSFQH